jgi:hypothetical protein
VSKESIQRGVKKRNDRSAGEQKARKILDTSKTPVRNNPANKLRRGGETPAKTRSVIKLNARRENRIHPRAEIPGRLQARGQRAKNSNRNPEQRATRRTKVKHQRKIPRRTSAPEAILRATENVADQRNGYKRTLNHKHHGRRSGSNHNARRTRTPAPRQGKRGRGACTGLLPEACVEASL